MCAIEREIVRDVGRLEIRSGGTVDDIVLASARGSVLAAQSQS